MSSRRVRVGDVLVLQRRTVAVDPEAEYQEIGLRSFGRGLFHKQPVTGADLGNKRVFRIEPGDLVVSNVFAWEGAVAVATHAEADKIGSHRFMTFVPTDDRIDTSWAAWFFQSEPGLERIRKASPGSAGRNRTLAIRRFEALEIPLLPLDEQRRVASRLERLTLCMQLLRQQLRQAQLLSDSLISSWLAENVTAGSKRGLSDLATVHRGGGPRYEGGSGYRAINQACVRWRGVDISRTREVDKAWWEEVPPQRRVHVDDVLVNSTGEGTIGRAAVADADATDLPFDSHVLAVRCNQAELLPMFLTAYLRSPRGQEQINAAKGANTTKQTELGKSKLAQLTVPAPPISCQRQLLDLYESLLRRAELLETSLMRRSQTVNAVLPSALNEVFAGLS